MVSTWVFVGSEGVEGEVFVRWGCRLQDRYDRGMRGVIRGGIPALSDPEMRPYGAWSVLRNRHTKLRYYAGGLTSARIRTALFVPAAIIVVQDPTCRPSTVAR